MSCENCKNIQNIVFNKNNPNTLPICYVRIGISNMAIVGCEKHCKELVEELREENK